jgi:type IV pilus assembly protein PilP
MNPSIQRRRTRMARELNAAIAMVAAVACTGALAACGSDAPPAASSGASRGAPRAGGPTTTAPAAHAPGATASTDDDSDRPPPLPLTEADFTESDRARDPFRSFAHEFVPQGPSIQIDEHAIKLREYAIETLTLVAVILGTDSPYAMVIDATGRGTIIRRGEYVGRPETVSGGDGLMPHQVPWRVARIVGSRVSRDDENNLTEVPGEVVFEREDRLNPAGGRAERVLSLSRTGEANRAADEAPTAPNLPTLPGFGPGGTPFLPSAPAGGSAGGGGNGAPQRMPPGGATFVQSYTTVVPPQQAAPAPPTTVVIQTGPQGQTTVTGPGVSGSGNAAPAPTGPRDPYGAPGGPAQGPGVPPVQVNDGPTQGGPGLPTSGLPH